MNDEARQPDLSRPVELSIFTDAKERIGTGEQNTLIHVGVPYSHLNVGTAVKLEGPRVARIANIKTYPSLEEMIEAEDPAQVAMNFGLKTLDKTELLNALKQKYGRLQGYEVICYDFEKPN